MEKMRYIFRNNKKGLIFTIDAILALLSAIVILIVIYSILSNTNINNEYQDLSKIALDSLTVSEKNNALNSGVSGDLSLLDNYLGALPVNICGNISLYYANQNIITSSKKPGCLINDNMVIARRVFVSNYKMYFAKIEVSYA